MSSNTIKKTIYFFRTVPDYSLFAKGTNDSTILQSMFNQRFPTLGQYSSKDGKSGIEIISADEHHIYGMFLKKDESTNKFLRLTLVKNDMQEEIDFKEQRVIFEYYSFFYVDLDKCMTSIISNKQSGKFTDIINQFLFEEGFSILFIPYSIDSLDTAIKKFSDVKYIDTLYSPSASQEVFRNLHQYHEKESLEIDKLKIQIKIKNTGPKFIEDLNKIRSEKEKYEKYTEQFFDILEKTFYRSAQIEIQGNPEENINFIKSKFQKEIELLYKQTDS